MLRTFTRVIGIYIVCALLVAWVAYTSQLSSSIMKSNMSCSVEWSGPYGGVPPFGTVSPTNVKGLLESAMSEALSNVNLIASSESAPTFDNVLKEFERSSRAFDRGMFCVCLVNCV
jgi:Zn-dependent oligopeptidase